MKKVSFSVSGHRKCCRRFLCTYRSHLATIWFARNVFIIILLTCTYPYSLIRSFICYFPQVLGSAWNCTRRCWTHLHSHRWQYEVRGENSGNAEFDPRRGTRYTVHSLFSQGCGSGYQSYQGQRLFHDGPMVERFIRESGYWSRSQDGTSRSDSCKYII